MTAKEHLRQIYVLSQRIDRLQQLREQLRADLYSVKSPAGSMTPDKVQTSMTGDKIERMIARVDKIEQDIVKEQTSLAVKRRKLLKEIEAVENNRYRQILFERYVLCKKWEDMAGDMGIELRWLYRLHGRALDEFRREYKSDH